MGMPLHQEPLPEGTVLPPRGYAWIVFACTFGLLLSDYMSRQVLNAVFPLLKAEWHLSDTELGSLAGVVALMVGLLTVPLSVLADRWGRVRSIVLMAALWSLATLGCALAETYGQMLLARFFVGIGEAAYGSVGVALILSIFPAHLRATLTGAFMAGGAFGSVLGMALGGAVAARLGWRWSFGSMALFGFALVALYLLLVSERRLAPRRAPDADAAAADAAIATAATASADAAAAAAADAAAADAAAAAAADAAAADAAASADAIASATDNATAAATAPGRVADAFPARRAAAASAAMDAAPEQRSWQATLRPLVGTRSVLCAYAGSGLQLFVMASVIAWMPSFMNRYYGMPADRAGVAAAVFVLLGGTGMVLCGVITDRVSRHDGARKWNSAIAYCLLACLLLGAGFSLSPGPAQLALLGIGMLFAAGTSGPAGAMVANLTPAWCHGAAFAVLTLVNNLLGLAPGPFLTGALADRIGLAGALQVAPLLALAASLLFALGRRHYAADLARLTSAAPATAACAADCSDGPAAAACAADGRAGRTAGCSEHAADGAGSRV